MSMLTKFAQDGRQRKARQSGGSIGRNMSDSTQRELLPPTQRLKLYDCKLKVNMRVKTSATAFVRRRGFAITVESR